MFTAKNPIVNFLLCAILIATLGLSACTSSTPSAPTETPVPSQTSQLTATQLPPTATQLPPTPTPLPEVTLTVSGAPFMFSHPLQIIQGNLWLPSVELFTLIGRNGAGVNDEFLATYGKNLNGKFFNCHFWIGRTGENTYTPDTEGTLWYASDLPPFVQDGEVYLSEKMIEDCMAGDFIRFDAQNKTANLNVSGMAFSAMQENNPNSVMVFKLKEVSELMDSRIGVLVSGIINTPSINWMDWADNLKDEGFTRARVTLNASDAPAIEGNMHGIEEAIPEEYIELYRKLDDLGIVTRYSLSFWDFAYQEAGGTLNLQRLSSDDEVERYLEYVRIVVTDLKGLVDEYELWNEPDANEGGYQRIEPEDYIAVAKKAIPLIREIDPDAKIVLIASSSYADLPCQEYSHQILSSDIISMADIISLHTVNNDASPVFLSDYYYGYDAMWQGIKSMAEEGGFTGEYYADELNYRSEISLSVLQPEPGNYHPYEPEIAAKYIARMIAINQGMDISVGTSGTNGFERPIEANVIRNMAFLFDGLKAFPFDLQVDSNAGLIRNYTFKDESGNLYIFIWNDDAANVESQDVTASIFLPDKGAVSVTAFDPYFMIMQPLVFDVTSQGLKIDQVFIRDYPLLYKIESE